MSKKAVIFDLDGVIVSTDEYHYQSWKKMANEEGIYFDRKINENLRGVSRMESLEIILERASKPYTSKEKTALAQRKNEYYKILLNQLTPAEILPGVMPVLEQLKRQGIKIAVGSSSKNTPVILEKIGLDHYFDAVADGNQIKNSKPDPEVFLLAAAQLQIRPEECVVIEDAVAGIDAALAGKMKAVAVGAAAGYAKAHVGFKDLTEISVAELLND
jgi:beta-phosphoglucomutase